MKIEEFMRHVMDIDFDRLVGEENEIRFAQFIKEQMEEQKEHIILRFYFEKGNPDEGVPLPYYVWAVYPMDSHSGIIGGELRLFPPDYSDPMTYLNIPEEIQGESYFEVVVEDK